MPAPALACYLVRVLRARSVVALMAVALLGSAPARAQDATGGEAGDRETPADRTARWCAPELEALDGDVCVKEPRRASAGPRTLVIFLHGVIQPDSGWQWAQQRAAARAAETHGFVAITPHGRRGHGPKGMEDWWTWPTGAAAQAEIEGALIDEWKATKATLETRSGKPFERVWVFGFSNGAYYATSLAVRGRVQPLGVQGFAVFAGGSGEAYLERAAKQAPVRAPVFVGWGGKDKAHRDQVALARMLKRIGWPSRSEGAPRAGHVMTDHQAASAVHFLEVARPLARP